MMWKLCLVFLLVWGVSGDCSFTSGGSSSVKPFAMAMASKLGAKFNVKMSVASSGSSTTGIAGASGGSFDIGHASRGLKPGEGGVKCIEIARDDIIVIANPALKLSNSLTLAGVVEIFSSKGTYTFIIPDKGSGTRSTFEDKAGAAVKANLAAVSGLVSDEALVSKVSSTADGVGFVSKGASIPAGVQKISVGGFGRPLYFCYNPDNSFVSEVKKYICNALDVAAEVASSTGFSPPSGGSGSLGCADLDLTDFAC
eukprot:TRINITY_DN12672_c0_g1_i1.p1 TRINITY_DN12672_c0_g1~~TRINITY_DN12672_c0_g1_i1.p1  ORF type:complete len:255 (+),score=66.93 TRINITY_DN12672_c0_g1_i1:322-1086(+)